MTLSQNSQPSGQSPSRIPRPSPKKSPAPPPPLRIRLEEKAKENEALKLRSEADAETARCQLKFIAALEAAANTHQEQMVKAVRSLLSCQHENRVLLEQIQLLQNVDSPTVCQLKDKLDEYRVRHGDLVTHNRLLQSKEVEYKHALEVSEKNMRELEIEKMECELHLKLYEEQVHQLKSEKLDVRFHLGAAQEREVQLMARVKELENDLREKEREVSAKDKQEAKHLAQIAQLKSFINTTRHELAEMNRMWQEAKNRNEHEDPDIIIPRANTFHHDHRNVPQHVPRTNLRERPARTVPAKNILVHVTVHVHTHDPASRTLLHRLHATLHRDEWRGEIGVLDFHGPHAAVEEIRDELENTASRENTLAVSRHHLALRVDRLSDELAHVKPELAVTKHENQALRTQLAINEAVLQGFREG